MGGLVAALSGESGTTLDKKPNKKKKRRRGRHPRRVTVRRTVQQQAWELVHPRCAKERDLDLEEARKMLQAGEPELARDELLWMLEECPQMIAAHRLLGQMALEEQNYHLARGHLGYAFQIGTRALEQAGNPIPVPYRLEANRDFLEAGRDLAVCLEHLGKPQLALEVRRQLLRLDPSDPFGLRRLVRGDQN